MDIEYIDLVMDNGELVRIETPTNHFDAVYESLDNCRKRGDMWSCVEYDGTFCIVEAHELPSMLADGNDGYNVTTVMLTRDQFEKLPEFTGF